MSPMVKQPLTIEHALLGFVRRQPMYGYEIHQQLQESKDLGMVWRIKQSQLYALLAKLEQVGYLQGTLEGQGSRPPRKMLQLTDEGLEAFTHWIGSPVQHGRDFRLEFLAKLYFARNESNEAALTLAACQRDASHIQLIELRQQASRLTQADSYDWLVLQFRIGQIEAILAWLDVCADWVADKTSYTCEH